MKNLIITVALLLSLWGCYHVPLSKPQGREVPQELIGHWKEMKGDSVVAVVTIMKATNELLFVSWVQADDDRPNDMFLSLYPVTVCGIECMQAVLLNSEKPIYTVGQYEIHNDSLTYSLWDSDIGSNFKNSKQMLKQFKESSKGDSLFEKQGVLLIRDSEKTP